MGQSAPASPPRTARAWRAFCPCSELSNPAAKQSRAPSSTGRSAAASATPAAEARTISTRWPARPNPVTSVQAVAPCPIRISAAARFDASIEASARSIHRPFALHRMSAANSVPVPSALVRISRSPGRMPALRSTRAGSACPVTARPSARSAPSPVWPPTSAAPASARTSFTPCIMSAISVAIFSSGPWGTVTMASAVRGSAPIA